MPHLPELDWDYHERLHEVTLDASNNKAYYLYNAGGERVRKVIVKGTTREERYYIGGFEVYRKYISSTLDYERETLLITEGRNTIANLETKTIENGNTISTPTTNQRYQYSNHLGSACLELDEDANIISYEEYHPFGTTSYRAGSSTTGVSLKRYKYVGKERDEETGLYYYGARFYAAWIARFISVDPLATERVWLTPYNYVQNSPINRIDPTGMLDWKPEMTENGDILLMAENGDNLETLKYFFRNNNMSEEKIESLYNSIKSIKPEFSSIFSNEEENPEAINLTEELCGIYLEIKNSFLTFKEFGSNHNCFSTSLNLSNDSLSLTGGDDMNLYNKPNNKPGLNADNELMKNYIQLTNIEDAIVGKTLIRWGEWNEFSEGKPEKVGNTTHFATFLGNDYFGNAYVISKNGESRIQIIKLETLSAMQDWGEKNFDNPQYGKQIGFGNGTGWYNRK